MKICQITALPNLVAYIQWIEEIKATELPEVDHGFDPT